MKTTKRPRPRKWIPNPATRGGRKEIEITDRAKRYRAQNSIRQPTRRCIYCGAPPAPGRRVDVEHINGDEADNSPENLAYACRPCNTKKGALFAKLGIGRKTRQYNPSRRGRLAYSPSANARPITSLGGWLEALFTLRGMGSDTSPRAIRAAAERIRATPPDLRSEFAHEIWGRRRARGTDTWAVPF